MASRRGSSRKRPTPTPSSLAAAGVGVTPTLTSCQHIQQTGLVYRPLAGLLIRLQAALAWRRDGPSAALRTVLAVAEDALPAPVSLGEIERERV